ncbi:MAG: nucleoside triphosphate pyrophosphohydrolase [Bacteroidota bacterium]|nr:nucleoside triphosphate pyrophosphohydrolase [Bacteroidota bacterium]
MKKKSFSNLVEIIDELREKCPWDKKQTKDSLRSLTLEECYELSEAILSNDTESIKNELGDILTHIIFYSRLYAEKNQFSIIDVINEQCEKLIRRHPHIYGDVKLKSEYDVKRNWELIKLKENNKKKSILDGVPKTLPSILKSWRIQEKVGGAGFEWKNVSRSLNKIDEEFNELKFEIENNNVENIEEEFGDVLFSLINYSRYLNINPVDALEKTNQKFIKRFKKMENEIYSDNKKIEDLTVSELEKYWNRIKKL